MSELNPCPICGCSVRVWAKRGEEDVEYIIECDNDFCGLTYGISCGYNRDEIKKAWNSVTALSSTVSEDCISRHALIDEILEDGNGVVLSYTQGMDEDELVERIEEQMIKHFIGVIEYAPPVESERPKGEWIQNAPEGQGIDPPYICSICGHAESTRTPFCEQCGADMKGEK